jgi:integrase
LADVESYVEGPRALAIEKARRRGLYEALSNAVVVGASKMRHCIALPAEGGGFVDRSVNLTDPSLRLRLYRRTSHGLEPLALWLNEDGMPRAAHAWHHTFSAANDRIAHLGLSNFSCTPHMLRHSFALRWFSIGKLVYSSRLTHLSGSEARDFRSQFGDTWHLVQTMLGHRRVETTKNVYLEPFRSLDVEVLLAHAEGQYPSDLFSELFEHHPLVATDPLRT